MATRQEETEAVKSLFERLMLLGPEDPEIEAYITSMGAQFGSDYGQKLRVILMILTERPQTTTDRLVLQYAALLRDQGQDSAEAANMVDVLRNNTDFQADRLAADLLHQALNP
jgi:hypothetical protein